MRDCSATFCETQARAVLSLAFEFLALMGGATHFGSPRQRGCDEAQGYLIARPMPAEKVTEFLANSASQWKQP